LPAANVIDDAAMKYKKHKEEVAAMRQKMNAPLTAEEQKLSNIGLAAVEDDTKRIYDSLTESILQ
jgi:hypothetical protein